MKVLIREKFINVLNAKDLVNQKLYFMEKIYLRDFFKCLQDIKNIDLIIIMGTSLKVYPFTGIPQ